MSDILSLPKGRGYSEADVRRVVETSDKQRFALEEEEEEGQLWIRANQGHSMEVCIYPLPERGRKGGREGEEGRETFFFRGRGDLCCHGNHVYFPPNPHSR